MQGELLLRTSELLRRLGNELLGHVYEAIHAEVPRKRNKREVTAACAHIEDSEERAIAERACVCEDGARYHAGVRAVIKRDHWDQSEGLERLRTVSRGWLKKQYDIVASTIWDETAQDIVSSLSGYMVGLSNLPRFKKFGVDHASIRTRDTDAFYIGGNAVHICKLEQPRVVRGKIKSKQTPFHFRKYRDLPSKASNVTLSLRHGRWYVTFTVKVESEEAAPDRSIGLDFGVSALIADSDGGFVDGIVDDPEDIAEKEFRQQRLSQMVHGSKNYERERAKLNLVEERITNKRTTRRHQASAYYAKNYRTICVEDLKTSNMTRTAKGTVDEPGKNVSAKSGLNRSIQRQGWYTLLMMIIYKVEQRGGRVVKVPPKSTSQTCSSCKHPDPANRISQACFRCTKCGFELNADTNAAKNIERLGLAKLNEPAKVAKPRKKRFTVGSRKIRSERDGLVVRPDVMS